MWRVNDEHVDLIAAAMGDQGPDFRALAMDTMYPDIYPTHHFGTLSSMRLTNGCQTISESRSRARNRF